MANESFLSTSNSSKDNLLHNISKPPSRHIEAINNSFQYNYKTDLAVTYVEIYVRFCQVKVHVIIIHKHVVFSPITTREQILAWWLLHTNTWTDLRFVAIHTQTRGPEPYNTWKSNWSSALYNLRLGKVCWRLIDFPYKTRGSQPYNKFKNLKWQS